MNNVCYIDYLPEGTIDVMLEVIHGQDETFYMINLRSTDFTFIYLEYELSLLMENVSSCPGINVFLLP